MSTQPQIEDIYALSPAQQGMLFHALYSPGTGMYLDQLTFHLRDTGAFDPAGFRRAVGRILERHPVLRSGFLWEGRDQPLQVVYQNVEPVLEERDWSALSEADADAGLRTLLGEDRRREFDLSRPPLVRFQLLRRTASHFLVVMTYQHIILDAWSLRRVMQELLAFYQAFHAGRDLEIEVPRPYRDYIAWLKKQDLAAAESFWRRQLDGFTAPTSLSAGGSDRTAQTDTGMRQMDHRAVLPAPLGAELRAFARRHRLTLNNLLQGAWSLLLSRVSAERDIVFGVTVSGRPDALTGAAEMVGLFINTLPFRARIQPGDVVLPWLRTLQDQQLTLTGYEHSPLAEVQSWSEVPHSTPLFESILIFENVLGGVRSAPDPQGTVPTVDVEVVFYEPKTNYPLTLMVDPSDLSVRALYAADRFDGATVARLLVHLESLLRAFVTAPERRLSELPLVTAAERHQLLAEWNDTALPYPAHCGLHEMVAEQALRAPAAPALEAAGRSWSYRELLERAHRLARRLLRCGVGPEVPVGLCVERSAEMVIGVLGVLASGGAYLPLDPAYPRERLRSIVKDARVPVILTSAALAGDWSGAAAQIVCFDADELAAEQESAGGDALPRVDPGNLAYVIYTSGSTGQPKGVQITHRTLVNFLTSMRRAPGLGPDDTLLAVTSLSFDIAGLEIFLPLLAGARVMLAGGDEISDGNALAARLATSRATVMQATPATWWLLLETGWQTGPGFRVLCGGEALDRELARRLGAQGNPVWNLYGPTETTIWSAAHAVESTAQGPVPIGRPIANTDLVVLDPDLNLVPAGLSGELYIGGEGLARGYLRRPSQTAERFVPHPFSQAPGARLYRTGDRVVLRHDGTLVFVERLDHQVKIRGFRIELGEIEAVLAAHPEVQRAAVLVLGEGANRRLAACVTRAAAVAETAGGDSSAPQRHLRHWREVWTETYSQDASGGDPTLNLAGWTSRITGLPIPRAEMKEWVERTVERIRALAPRRIYEIGCGTGMLLARLAPFCEDYWASDFSPSALEHVREQVALDGTRAPRLLWRTADDFSELPSGTFDLIVLNSVVQYFPSAEYLLHVLAGAACLLAPGGRIFLGDVICLPLAGALHLAAELERSAPELPVAELGARSRRRMVEERELFVDPAFFQTLGERLPSLSGIEIQLKRGRHHNELTRFRYDAVLTVGGGDPPPAACRWLDYEADGLTLAGLRQALAAAISDGLGVRNVPNARLSREVRLRELVAGAGDTATVAELRRDLEESAGHGIDPEDLWQMGEELGLAVEVGWDAGGRCRAVFRPRSSQPSGTVGDRGLTTQAAAALPPGAYTNHPLRMDDNAGLTAELRRMSAEKLPSYMLPATFLVLPEMPLTPNGKTDRIALRRTVADAGGEGGAGGSHDRSRAPRTPTEEILAGLWQQILGLPKVGLDDNFFELGGHSLSGSRMIARIRRDFQIDLSLRTLFLHPVLEALAGEADAALRREAVAEPPLVPVDRGGMPEGLPLSFAQQRLWIVSQLDPDSGAYNLPVVQRIRGALAAPVLERALSEILRRHEALRTGFVAAAGDPRQVILATQPWRLPVIDLRGLPEDRRESVAGRIGTGEAERPFDLERPPLLRTALVRLGDEDHVLISVMHHIVSDAWSLEVFARELMILYRELAAGEPSSLAELPIQYADYAVWQRQLLAGDALERRLGYWRRHLRGAPRSLDLPGRRDVQGEPSSRGAHLIFALPPDLSQALAELCRKERVTLFMALLAAFKTLLFRYTGSTDLVVGTDLANRKQIELEGLIGFFINVVPLRTTLAAGATFRELLHKVREVALGAYAHQDVPFDRLVSELRPERTLRPSALFDVLFVMQNVPSAAPSATRVQVEPFGFDYGFSRFDLALFLHEEGKMLTGRWNYRTDLFSRETIEKLSRHFQTLVASAVANPAARLDSITYLDTNEVMARMEKRTEERKKSFQLFKQAQPKAVHLGEEVVQIGSLSDRPFPVVIQPAREDVDLADWAAANRPLIEDKLLRHGAVLFRGFPVPSGQAFERAARAICPDLYGEYGDLPKEQAGEKLYRSTPYPADKTILFHNESSHTPRWPLRQFFYSVKSASRGGETPIIDGREVLRRLDPSLRELFTRKGLRYVRNFIPGVDVSWQDFFKTDDPAVVEEHCRGSEIGFEWRDGGRELRCWQIAPAVARHPMTGEEVFFNQIQLHHVACLDEAVRAPLESLFSRDEMPRNVYYGDGTPIEDSLVREILQLYWDCSVSFPWREGDILAVDNMLVAHARNPFEGERKMMVAMGRMFERTALDNQGLPSRVQP